MQEEGIQSPELIEEQTTYLVGHNKTDEALAILRRFCRNPETATVAVWIQWAQLVNDPGSILQEALDRTPMETTEYMILLLERFGALLIDTDADASIVKDTFAKIMLLAPGRASEGPCSFGVESVASACLQYLRYANLMGGIEKARREVMDHISLRSNYCE